MEVNYTTREIVYDGLAELTKSTPNRYFSRNDVLNQIKSNLEESMEIEIHRGRGYMQAKDGYWKGKMVNLSEILPRKNDMGPTLDLLVEEGEAEFSNFPNEYRIKQYGPKYYRIKEVK
jgi:hypothetical protein